MQGIGKDWNPAAQISAGMWEVFSGLLGGKEDLFKRN